MNRNGFIIFFIFLLFAGLVSAQENNAEFPFEVTASADKEEVNVGDIINVEALTEEVEGFEVMFPEEPRHMGYFTFISSEPIEKGWGPSKQVGRAYVMSIYTTGAHAIPPITVEFRDENTGVVGEVMSPQVPIKVRSLLSAEDKDIKDIKGLLEFKSTLKWLVLILFVIFALTIVGLFLLRGFRKVLAREEKELSAHEKAYKRFSELKAKDLPGHGLVKEYYSMLSDIVRRYLEERFAYKAPEMTTEEFLDFVKKDPKMQKAHKDILKEFLSHCDMVKFAKYGPAPLEMIDSFNAAKNFVDETKQEDDAEEEDDKVR